MATTALQGTSASATRPRTLSKSDFKLARSCDAKLYFRENGFADRRAWDPYLQFLAEGGYMVEALAKAKYAGGVQLQYGRDVAEDHRRTAELLQRENITLFEATLLAGRRLARADVLHKTGNIVRLIEVKAKSIDSAEHRASLDDGGRGLFWTKNGKRINADWIEKLEDITFQVLILERMLPGANIRPVLALVDKSKRASVDGIPSLFELVHELRSDGTRRLVTANYTGDPRLLPQLDLVTEFDVADEVEELRDEVEAAAQRFESLLDAPLEQFLTGVTRDSKCVQCEFRSDGDEDSGFDMCWGPLARAEPHFLQLHRVGSARGPNGGRLVNWMWSQGKSSLLDVPVDALARKDGSIGPDAERQRRQIEHTSNGTIFISPSLRSQIESVRWPAYFIDFETSRLALPSHRQMRPYGVVTFQWSCHKVSAPGARPEHVDWLNSTDLWPNQTFAERLRDAIGNRGSVVTWSRFEGVTLRQIVPDLAEFGHEVPDLVEWLHSVGSRVVDLHEWARNDYYHPGMMGRTSIKVVLDALWKSDSQMREQFEEWTGLSADGAQDPYEALEPILIDGEERAVREGTGAMRAYDAMMYGPCKDDPVVVAQWEKLLRQYCHLDTLAMVLIFEHWRRATDPA